MSASTSDHLRINVVSLEGGVWVAKVSRTTSIDKLKSLAVSHYFNPKVHTISSTRKFRLVSVTSRLPLSDSKSIAQEDLKDNDEVLLVECREPPPKEALVESLRGPTINDITEATKNLEERNRARPQPAPESIVDFQNEVRRILISLVEAAARLLASSPDGMEIFHLLNERMKLREEPAPGNPYLTQLTDMGFTERRAVRALKIKKMNLSEATEWLLHHDSESSEEEEASSSSQPEPSSVVEAFQGLLRTLQKAKQREFQPNSKYVESLKEMGFREEDIKEALRVTGNNRAAACSWLVGEKKETISDINQGLDQDGPIYKAIMANPVIQLNLTKPKVLLAFLSMLDNPSTADLWINDHDTSPVLNQIFKTYHTEKHAKQVNEVINGQVPQFRESPETSLSSQLHSFFGDNLGDEELEDELDEDDEDEIADLVWSP